MGYGPIWLIGMMGAGKTTVAPLVADRLGRDWCDADTLTVERTGRSIEEWFAHSEPAFRQEEAATIEDLGRTDMVVATGGGAPLGPGGEVMRRHGIVVWLKAAPETLVGRIEIDEAIRPVASGGDSATIARLVAERDGVYAVLADVVVETDESGPEAIAEEVVEACSNAGSEE